MLKGSRPVLHAIQRSLLKTRVIAALTSNSTTPRTSFGSFQANCALDLACSARRCLHRHIPCGACCVSDLACSAIRHLFGLLPSITCRLSSLTCRACRRLLCPLPTFASGASGTLANSRSRCLDAFFYSLPRFAGQICSCAAEILDHGVKPLICKA